MDAVPRRRFYALGAASLIAYASSLVLIGLAVGFDHGAGQWLLAAAFSAMAMWMTADFLLVAVLVAGGPSRAKWWTSAGPLSRALKAFFLFARLAAAIVMWWAALGILRR
jgi:hypothetical protein